MKTWKTISATLNKALTVTGAMLLLMIAIGITVEVLLRKIFNTSLGGMDELASYGFAIFTSLAFSVATIARANIRIDMVRALLPKGFRITLDLIAQIALISFVGFLAWRSILLVSASWANGTKAITPLATPVAWPQTAWLAGLFIFVTLLVVMFALSLRALIRGDSSAFASLASPVGEMDEITSEILVSGTTHPTKAREA